MKTYRYVTLDPTGNLTCLVLEPVDPAEKEILTRKLLAECEQVAYLTPPGRPEAVAAVHLMGGEFCGNAAMAAAAWLVRDELSQGKTKTLLLEVSGAVNPVRCIVRKTRDGFEGTVEMPGGFQIGGETICGIPFTVVRMEGIVHLVSERQTFEQKEAEKLIGKLAGLLPDDAVGLLQWNSSRQFLLPLVFVRGSDSVVWEHGCGSGSAAVGALEALRNGKETTVSVEQPGGVIRVNADSKNGRVSAVSITGQIRVKAENTISIK